MKLDGLSQHFSVLHTAQAGHEVLSEQSIESSNSKQNSRGIADLQKRTLSGLLSGSR